MPSSPDALSGLHCALETASTTSQLSQAHSGGGFQPRSLAVEHCAQRMRVQRRRGVDSRADVSGTCPALRGARVSRWTHRVQ